MIRFLIRALGYMALAGAFVAAAVDGTRSIASSGLAYTSLGAGLDRLAPSAQAMIQAASARVSPLLWDNGAAWLMRAPLALVLLLLGLLLVWLVSEREPVVGYDSRA
ncbi:hypothetical protein SLNSH_15905 [Alsobacter soli]|uniref:PetM family of cytochrome b6f complex subunit 7 n=1 Tax=Alsobacter soli TaxID=2109933 RepID=A0A2T1HR16_9HYPH|nr:hypothetical protein [Alsobacter soli]PSC04086.1 hypothetical protein SLNSH_15905 [Alsobacter soli]